MPRRRPRADPDDDGNSRRRPQRPQPIPPSQAEQPASSRPANNPEAPRPAQGPPARPAKVPPARPANDPEAPRPARGPPARPVIDPEAPRPAEGPAAPVPGSPAQIADEALVKAWQAAGHEAYSLDDASVTDPAEIVRIAEAYTADLECKESCAMCGVSFFGSGVLHGVDALIRRRAALEHLQFDEVAHRQASDRPPESLTLIEFGGRKYHMHHIRPDGSFITCSQCCADLERAADATIRWRERTRAERRRLSLVLGRDYGPMPDHLPHLTVVEMIMIAKVRIYRHVIKLTGGMAGNRGHTICFPHDAPKQITTLPMLSADDIGVILLQRPNQQHSRQSPLHPSLTVNRTAVMAWLIWLKNNNRLYADITILDAAHARWDEMDALLQDPVVQESADAVDMDDAVRSNVADSTDRPDLEAVLVDRRRTRNDPAAVFRTVLNLMGEEEAELDAPAPAAPVLRPVDERAPTNEFLTNGISIMQSFPCLFPYGFGLEDCHASIPTSVVRHLLSQRSGRFERCMDLIFLLFDQKQRHEVARAVSAKCRADRVVEFTTLVRSENFRSRLRAAIADPTSADAKLLASRLVRSLSMYSEKVSFGPLQRNQIVAKAIAMTHLYGLPSLFVTVAPPDHEQRSTFTLSNQTGEMLSVPLTAASHDRLRKHVLAHPVSAARTFEAIVQAFIKHIVGLDPNQRFSAPGHGVFGKSFAVLLATEGQGRGALHFHSPIWAGIAPDLLSAIVDDDAKIAQAAAVLDSLVSTLIPAELRAQKEDGDFAHAHWAAEPLKPEQMNIDSIRLRGEQVAVCRNDHEHSHTCHKGHSGRKRCRFYLPAPEQDRTAPHFLEQCSGGTVHEVERPPVGLAPRWDAVDPRVHTWELKRAKPDAKMSTFNWILSALTSSNTAVIPLFNLEASLSSIYYIIPYIVKDVTSPANVLPLMELALRNPRPPTFLEGEDHEMRTALNSLQRILNAVGSITETSAQLAAFSLIGREPWQTTCSFGYLHYPTLIRKARSLWATELAQPLEAVPMEAANAPTDPDVWRMFHAPGLVFDSESEGAEDLADPATATEELLDVRGTADGTSLEVDETEKGQHIDYLDRGADLATLCMYEYVMLINVTPKARVAADLEADADEEVERAPGGRPTNHVFDFCPPRERSHQKLRSKLLVPQITGRPMRYPGPPQNTRAWQVQAAKWAEYVSILFLPWDRTTPVSRSFRHVKQILDGYEASESLRQRSIVRVVRSLTVLKHEQVKRRMMAEFRARATPLWTDRERQTYEAEASVQTRVDDAVAEQALLAAVHDREFTQSNSASIAKQYAESVVGRFRDELPAVTAGAAAHGGGADPDVSVRVDRGAVLDAIKDYDDDDADGGPDNADDAAATGVDNGAAQLPDDPESTFSPEQRRVFLELKAFLDGRSAFRRDPAHHVTPPGLRLLIHGGPGCGKTYLITALIRQFQREIRCCAFTACAANLLPRGRTIHNLLGFTVGQHGLEAQEQIPPIRDQARLHKMRQRLRETDLIVIDEVSMLSAVSLSNIETRLRLLGDSNLEFGGFGVVLLGDFYQIEPVTGSSLIQRQSTVKGRHGADLFQGFAVRFFTTQQRARDDTQQSDLVARLRDHTLGGPPLRDYALPYRFLGSDDHRFSFAPVICGSNVVRSAINRLQIQRFAHATGQPICSWRAPISAGITSRMNVEQIETFYRDEDGLVSWFVRGAPVFVNENVNPILGVSNGTDGRLFSIEDDNGEEIRFADGDVLPQPPKYVCVHFPGIVFSEQKWGTRSISSNSVVIPFALAPEKFVCTMYSGHKISASVPKLDLAFAITFWKSQGRTLAEAIIDLNDAVGIANIPKVLLEMLYVAFTRVRSTDDLRLLPLALGCTLDHLKKLQMARSTREWVTLMTAVLPDRGHN